MTEKQAPEGWHFHPNGGGLVQDTAQVYGNAQVSGDAWVSGNARVSGDAQVYGNARVYGDAWVSSPLYIQGTRHSLTNSAHGFIAIGCHEHEFAYWKKHYKAVGRAEGYTKEQIKEYGQLIDLFISIGK